MRSIRKNSDFDKEIIGTLIVWFLNLLVFLFFSASLLPKVINGTPQIVAINWQTFWTAFANWDGGHYLGIAENGYVTNYQYAFFPLYPLVIKFVSFFTKNYLTSGLLVSWLSLFFSIMILSKLLIIDFSERISKRAVFYLLIFPSSIFLIATYSESFYLLLITLAFYFLRRKNWFQSSLAITLAAVTKPFGILLIIPFAFEYFSSTRLSFSKFVFGVGYFVICSLGLISFIWFLKISVNNPLAFISAQVHWQRLPSFPVHTIVLNYLDVAGLNNLGTTFFAQQLINVGTIILTIAIAAVSFVKHRVSYFTFLALTVLLPLTTGSVVSFVRLIIPAFPLYLVLADWGENKMFHTFWTLFSLSLSALISALFINGYWIA